MEWHDATFCDGCRLVTSLHVLENGDVSGHENGAERPNESNAGRIASSRSVILVSRIQETERSVVRSHDLMPSVVILEGYPPMHSEDEKNS